MTLLITAPLLQLEALSKHYPGGTQALDSVSLAMNPGEILCLLGPSGCGKTTLLRVVAGLEKADHGRVIFAGQDLANVAVHRRGFGFMFQDFALFPHRTVAENIAFGLRMAGLSRSQQEERVNEMLDLVNLPGYGKRTVFDLSGGERQRVALARSLAPKPSLLMLDEPLGSLDRALREELVEELRAILKEMKVTALYVTHDQDEAMALGDRMVIMQRGHIEQDGAPAQLYLQPATAFVARFLGLTNLLPATPSALGVMTPLGPVPVITTAKAGQVTLLIRPEAARLAPTTSQNSIGFQSVANSSEEILLHGRLLAMTYHGNYYRIAVNVNPKSALQPQLPTLIFHLPTLQRSQIDQILQPLQLPSIGEQIDLRIDTKLTTLLPYAAPAP